MYFTIQLGEAVVSWTYDAMGHMLTHTDRKGQVTEVSYDALNRRSLVSSADGSGIQPSYDAGNRLRASNCRSTRGHSCGWGVGMSCRVFQ
ncbi:RHS Repeat family protein [Burkholderia pseudomallei TSV28]|nr:RHS Repeat family protein [Burkholderia pseudomallei TSV28]